MKLDRTRIALLLVLAFLAGLPGVLSAACGPCPARSGAMSCCHSSAAPTIKAPPCCPTVKTLPPALASRPVEPPAPVPAVLAVPFALPAELRPEPPLPATSSVPPFLHEGVGLYTLHAVFLI
jgi:hypothetical protein